MSLKSDQGYLLARVSGAAMLCLLLAGCPSSSNPTQPQAPSIPSPATSSSSSSASSSSSSSSSSSASSQPGSQSRQGSTSSQEDSTDQQAQGGREQAGGQNQGSSSSASGDTGDLGEFPQGEFPGTEGTAGSSGSDEGGAAEPGFGETGAAGDALPDMRDEPSFEEVLGGMEDAMGEGQGTGASSQGEAGGAGHTPGGYGDDSERSGSEGSGGPLTPGEQVAVLDAELEQSTGDFDSMILEEQANQRRTARERSSSADGSESQQTAGGTGGYGSGDSAEGGVADAGGYSTGGGMGGASRGAESIPKNTAKYPPPADIPDGDDDDVVARQLREAAMREPDPAVREKLWDEYRKYKGID